jgi:hypothetical protein
MYGSVSGCRVSFRQGLPAELQHFLTSGQIRSVLVRGAPGSGRSLLARSLLQAYEGERVYVSDTVRAPSPPVRAEEGSALPPIQFLSMEEFQSPASPSDFARISGVLRDPGAGRRRLADVIAPGAAPPGARNGEASVHRMVVVDRWRSFVEYVRSARMARGHHTPLQTEEEERGMLRSLLGRVDKLIVVSRDGSDTAIDDLVDGIVELHQSFVDDRMERWLRLVKMRGVGAERSLHPFTLVDGEFRSFIGFPLARALHGAQAEADPEPAPPAMWPGSAAIAQAFGRFPTSSVTLIEVDAQVPFEVQYMLAIPFIVSTIRARGRVVAVPPPLIRPDRLWEAFIAGMSEKRVAEVRAFLPEQLRVLSHFGAGATDPDFAKSVVPLRAPGERRMQGPPLPHETPLTAGEIPFDSPKARFPHVFRFTGENPSGAPNAIVLFIDGLVAVAREIGSGYTPGALAAVLQREVAGYPLHIMVWSSEGEPLIRPLEAIAGLHLRLRAKQGHFFLHGIRPWTPNFIIQPAEEDGPEAAPFALVQIR